MSGSTFLPSTRPLPVLTTNGLPTIITTTFAPTPLTTTVTNGAGEGGGGLTGPQGCLKYSNIEFYLINYDRFNDG